MKTVACPHCGLLIKGARGGKDKAQCPFCKRLLAEEPDEKERETPANTRRKLVEYVILVLIGIACFGTVIALINHP